MTDKTQGWHGRRIKSLIHDLAKEIDAYLGFTTNEMGTPNERRKQLALIVAEVSVGLDRLSLPNTGDHRRFLRYREHAGLVVK